jgi:hypothetical protein
MVCLYPSAHLNNCSDQVIDMAADLRTSFHTHRCCNVTASQAGLDRRRIRQRTKPEDFYRISLCSCERVAEKGDFGSCFRSPLSPHPTRPRRQACQGFLEPPRQTVTHVFDTLPFPSPPPERPILAPRALSPKWTSLDLLCGSWLAVYMGPCPQQVFAPCLPRRPLSLSSGFDFLSAGGCLERSEPDLRRMLFGSDEVRWTIMVDVANE